MKKFLCLLWALVIFLSGCVPSSITAFTINSDGNPVAPSGEEYTALIGKDSLFLLGERQFIGHIQGESRYTWHLFFIPTRTGMYALKGNQNDNLLIRQRPGSEWSSIYRKSSLPAFEPTVDHCIQLKFVPGLVYEEKDFDRATSKEGITDQAEIAAFLAEVRQQQSPKEAGLYDIIKKPDGTYENCYVYGTICGFFAEEPSLVLSMEIYSFNDLAYSVTVDGKQYVLTEAWFEKITQAK